MISTDWLTAGFNHVWQSTLILALVWVLTLALRKQRARVRYAIWLAASLKFLLPFSLLIAAGAALHSRPVEHLPTANLSHAMERVTIPFTMEQNTVVAISSGSVETEPSPSHSFAIPLLLVWLSGALTLTTLWSRHWLRLRMAVRVAEQAGDFFGLAIRTSSSLMEPGVFGFLRPVIVLPRGMEERLTPSQMQAILLHEMSHARRFDNLTAALHMVVQAVFWFHPAVWWLKTRLVEERERACDEAVLDMQPDAHVYAEGILAVCRFYTESPLTCAAGVTGADLRKRITRIVTAATTQRLQTRHKLLFGAVLLLTVAIPLGIGITRVYAASTVAMEEAQAAALASEKMEFEVASIRLNKDGVIPGNPVSTNVDLDPGDIFTPTGGIFSLRNKSLRTLIAFAYKMSGDQQNFLKLNVPDFVLTERFDVEARTLKRDATKDDFRAMMRSLLEERFKLKVHNETREAKVYAMVQSTPGKLGKTMRMHPADDKTCESREAKEKLPRLMPDGYPALCGTIALMQWQSQESAESKFGMKIGGRNVPMSLIAAALVAPYTGDTGLDHAVVDKTGITGNVDFTLQLGYDEMEVTNTPNTAPFFLGELRDQLGMKLKADKGEINVYVVDHVEHLIEN